MSEYRFKILEFSNYDGDSFDLTLDLGFNLITHKKCRINGVDTPELRGGTDEQKKAGIVARDVARQWVIEAQAGGTAYFTSEGYKGKFGRPLGDIVSESGDSMRDFLIRMHYGVPYHGQAKREVADLHEINLQILKDRGDI